MELIENTSNSVRLVLILNPNKVQKWPLGAFDYLEVGLVDLREQFLGILLAKLKVVVAQMRKQLARCDFADGHVPHTARLPPVSIAKLSHQQLNLFTAHYVLVFCGALFFHGALTNQKSNAAHEEEVRRRFVKHRLLAFQLGLLAVEALHFVASQHLAVF